ncbi:hypothetical protein SDC9_198195 [bioreactor metagenome]|uniref:Uncharacterized protein n=1 Tax=bioreactor metagenome TaxID=1076179 RepID=A0A645IGZ0_9ZZZZ
MVCQVLRCPFSYVLIRGVEHSILSRMHRQPYVVGGSLIPDHPELFAEIVPPFQCVDRMGAEGYDVRADAEQTYLVPYVVIHDIVQRFQVGPYKFRQDVGGRIPRRTGPQFCPRYADGEACIADSHPDTCIPLCCLRI